MGKRNSKAMRVEMATGMTPPAEQRQMARRDPGFASLQYERRFRRRIKKMTMPALANSVPETMANIELTLLIIVAVPPVIYSRGNVS